MSIDAGDVLAAILAAIAILVSITALVLERRTQKKQHDTEKEQQDIQRRLAAIEEERRAEEVDQRKRAEVTARFDKTVNSLGRLSDRFVVQNLGPAPSREISFEMLQPTPDAELPRIHTEGHKLPIPYLDRGQEYPFVASVFGSVAPAVEVRLRWEDETGRREKTLVVPVF
jgi:hypothetical protein